MCRIALALTLLLAAPAAAGAETLEEIEVPTRDGATVHVEIARPDGDAKVPIILTYSPYNTLAATPVSNLASGSPWIKEGYARAYADVVGTRNSTGCWDYGGPIEQRSGVDLVGALSKLPWSNGKVAMQGVSYDGTTANMVAAQGDVPGLAAVVPVAAISRWYGYAYQDGVRYLGNSQEPYDEGFDTPFAFDFGFGRTPPDRPGAAAILDRLKPCDSVDHTSHAYSTTPDYDEFWLKRDYRKDAAKFRVPTFIVHGWQDFNVKQSEGIDLYEQIPVDDPKTPAIEGVPFKMLHLHQAPHADGAGDEYDERLSAFFAHTLLGVDNGIEREAPVRTQTRIGLKAGDFERTTSWPPPGSRARPFALGRAKGKGTLGEGGGKASLTDHGNTSEEVAINDLEGERTWLSYATAPLDATARLAGTPRLRLKVQSSSTDGQLAATLVDIPPSGDPTPITRGHLDMRYRDGLAKAKPTAPGTGYDVTVTLAPQDQTVEAGHRIGLIVAGSDTVWAVPSPGTRTFTVTGGALELPVVGPIEVAPEPTTTPAPDGSSPPPTTSSPRLTAHLRRAGRRHVRVKGVAPEGSRVTISIRRGGRVLARRTFVAKLRYSVRFKARRTKRLHARVVARTADGARLVARA